MSNELPARPERKWLDLSLAQQSVWLDAKLSGTSVYQLGGWARTAAPLDEAAVRQSVKLIMARHDALRLRVDDELPRQWLDESGEPPVTAVDLGDVADPDAAFQQHVEQAFATPMPLGDHPMFRIELLRAGPNLTYLLWRFHHLIADSASVSIALAHWFNAYDALTASEPQELAPPSSYLKTIAADAAYLQSAAHHQDLAYWAERFDPMPPPLIADMEPRPSAITKVPVADCTLAGESFAKLEAAAKQAGTTANRALFALFTLALGRRYGQSDLVAGIALHRRDLSNLHVIGMMAGVIAVRWHFDPTASLEEAVASFSEQVDADLRHQRMPVDVLSRSLGLSGTGRAGLFEAAMSYIPVGRGQGASPVDGLPVTTGVVDTKEASPISLHAAEVPGGGVQVHVAVNPDFLDPSEATTLAKLLRMAIDLFVDDPDAPCEELRALSSTEKQQVLLEWNQTAMPFELGTLDGLFAAQVARTPDALAIVGVDGVELSYADLDRRSSELARHLVSRGITPGQVVGVRMVRSTGTIVAAMAILKAGGIYLPLDPAYPADRLDYIASDAGAALVLDSIEGLSGDGELPSLTDPARVAYVIYTSGTTGKPKGVAVPHSAAVNLAFARRACHDPIGPGDRVLAAISVGFDVSIGQLLLPLLSGAAVVIAGDVKTMGAAEFWQLLAERRVTHVNSVPSFFDSILDAAPAGLRLKRLMLGGESLTGALVGRITAAVTGVEVVNMYGPTEACIDATFHIATTADLSAAVLPIGRPLSNYTAYVLDGQLEPVGVGVSGELYLGGAGLARGYVNAEQLTAERFVPNPFGDGRLYKTGDRARWRADGAIEFLGRVDQQVKIRGFRVEPGEIEAALLGHASVAQAVVVPHSSRPGAAARLIAYVVPRSAGAVPEAAALREHLSRLLPEYMVPSAFVTIAEVPLTANGKLDVKGLPSPDLREWEHVAPRTPTEETIAGLFSEVLGLDRCGATDHFFELGGHSLLATSLVSKMHAIGMAVPLRAIFETPTVELLARRIDASLPAAHVAESIGGKPRPAAIPLSYPQERIWFIDRLQQDSSYNIPIAFELGGKLDVAAAERAMQRIVARHEVLRTRIVMVDGRPAQSVVEQPEIVLHHADLVALEARERDATIRGRLDALATHRFDLANELPFVASLFAMEVDRHVLAVVIHHVAFDGWSAGLFMREFAALYSAFAKQGADPLPLPAIQYADFAIWQRQQNWEADRAFWLDALAGAPARLELPALEISEGTRRSGSLPVRLEPSLHAKLRKLAHDNGASLFMVLHAAFALLMSRLSGQDDVVIGTVTAGRSRPELEPLIGCFVNTLALRTTFTPGESFTRLLARVKGADLAAYAHQDLPFEQLVEALAPERSLQHTPIFQVMLVLQNAPMPVAELPGLAVVPIEVPAGSAKFDLTLSLSEVDGGLTGTLEFARNRFAPDAIERIAAKFERLLEAAVADPERDASQIDLLDLTERSLVVDAWNQTAMPFQTGTLDGMFAAQAARTPDALALVDVDGTEFTYAALDAWSTRVARHLESVGVGAEAVVGVRKVRSAETVAALLGILKVGGTYLPLDPAYPADRLAYMAADAGAALVLESTVGLDGDGELSVPSDPARLAYIIYTSGTTGRPKGVAVAHAAAVNLAFARRAGHDPIGPGDRVLAAISVGFDVSIGQLLLPLLSGAAVVVAGDVKSIGAAAFWQLLAERRVTHVNSVPSFFDSILDAAPSAGSLHLKRLMLGGEPLSGALVGRIWNAVPGVEVVNMYGPTEACIDATYHGATAADLPLAVLPIGRPLANYTGYVLDGQLNPVGVGTAGELYLGGAGLARGYVNAAELTAERFVANPFGEGRLYKTGDRARWRTDGRLEFLGRADEQVKIRGFRVEPGEVEAQLRQLPGVREAAVIAEQANGAARLIAYCTGDALPTPDALRAGLSAVLPDYMVPAAFVSLDALPLSPNGKLDRRALPKPGQEAFAARPFAPPVGEVETKMSALWAELLGVERVGRHDNFFELGGHSLLAVTLIERLQQAGLPGDVRGLFTSPTIAGLSAVASEFATEVPPNGILAGGTRITPEMLPLVALEQSRIDGIVAAVPGGAANVQDIYPLSPLQEGILFQHLMTTEGDPYLTPFLLGFDGRERVDTFVAALKQLLRRHDVLRTSMAWRDLDKPVQVVWREVELPVEEVSLDRAALMARYSPRSYRLDLSVAPLLRVVIARDGDQWLLLMLTHHLVLDHTSLAILVHELRTLMANSGTALPPALPYRNFIAQTLGGATLAQHEAFFSRMLGDVDEPTAPYGLLDVQAGKGTTIEERLTLAPTLSERVRSRARAMGVTPASLFHLAWGAVLGHVSGRSDVVFGTVLFGRMRSGSGADRVVGMFINTLPIRVALDGTGAAEGVMRTHQLLAELLEHEHAPLSLAQRCSGVAAPTPLFSSLFNYRYSAAGSEQVDDSGIKIVEASERTNYPLAMAIDDTGVDFLLTALGQAEAEPARVCAYLQQALANLMDLLDWSPAKPVAELQVLPDAERRLVVEAWNRTGATFEAGTLDGLFGAQVVRSPDAVAVVDVDGVELSYAELDRRSTALGRHLVSAGVVPGQVVGVRMVRSADTIVALLGILKAGAVYLPLDPAYPADRLAYIAADAGAVRVLESIDGLAGNCDLPVLGDPARVAYVIYTSGTTGKPKGVAVPHSAAVNLAFARRGCHDPIGPGDRVLAAISVGFDVSIGQLLLPLLSGATVVVAGDVKTMGAASFWQLLAGRRVTHVNSVPSFLDSILDAAPPRLSLKRLMLGGEPLSGALVGRIWRAMPGVDVVNMYGPTEACIDATFHVATEADLPLAVLPIGRPLSNYTAHVLDANRNPVGVGVSGELYLGGAGLADGYVNAPELTAERFVANPFGAGRLYKTGDRARLRGDGAVEFQGRVDEQVKIRGFRVEPGEIEAQLRLQPGVQEAVVVAVGTNGSTRLVAYCTGEGLPDVLRAGLARALPDYMVPAAFVSLDRLPLTANGKLDRRALPVPDQEAVAARAYEAPVGDVETRMAGLWAELLKLQRVGRHDNFFEIGGNSLLAVTLVERMRHHGLPGDVRTLFTCPTVAGMASGSGDALSSSVVVPDNLIPSAAGAITPAMLPMVSLSQAQLDRIVASVPGGAANVQDIYPLAPLQEGILFQHLVTPVGDAYLSPFLLGFDSRERVDRFLGALREVVRRHDVLRTAMAWANLDRPVQVVWRQAELPVREVSLDRATLMAEYGPQVHRLDLSKAPLLEVVITREGERWLVLMSTHHLVLDHTSVEILVGELRALTLDPAVVLPEPLQYRNFIAQTLGGLTREDHERFFTRMLDGVEQPTAPFGVVEAQANAERTIEGRLSVGRALSDRARRRARAMGVTPASLLHLAWGAVLGHVSGTDDVVFGTVLFGRMRGGEGADRVVGMFINTLPIRLKLDDAGVSDAVRSVHGALAELMDHEHAALSLAQRCASIPAGTPLFSSLFNYRHSGGEGEGGGNGGVEVIASSERTNYPLAMAVDDSGSDFLLSALGQPETHPQAVCEYLRVALERLLDLLETAPATPVKQLQVLPDAERRLVVEAWNRTGATFEAGTLDGLFGAQVVRSPDAVAVVDVDGVELSYAELDRRSTALGRHLVSAGVVPGQVVGVRMVRSADTIVALLGILKAGAVYLPLDPAYPADRLAYIAADAGAVRVLESIDGLAGNCDLPVLGDPARVAYVIYTSGTTGKPKGVAVPHSAAVNLAFARRGCHDPIGPGDRVLAAISVGFDVSIGQLLLPLLSGATVVVAGDVKTMGAASFWQLLAGRRVTHVNSVPSFLDSILDAAPPRLSLKRLMLGGEPLSGALVGRIWRAMPGVDVVNMYGPTEACIDATFHVATEADLPLAVLPIGRPLSNYTAHVLDANRNPVGVGVSGELYLGGAGLADGYVNAPELTAERFVANPFGAGRLYKTGDRARLRGDGAVEFQGRVDEQVKIRGFRVEPGEIEAQLRLQPGVQEAVVVAVGTNGSTRLVAYCTGEGLPDVLRAGLARALPDYMVPAAFVSLDRLPLTANGKLDRRALPVPDQEAVAARAYEAPVGDVETRMAGLWAELLKLQRVGRHDNFFEIGGDSLGALRLANAIGAAFDVNVPVQVLFQRPTVLSLSQAVVAGVGHQHGRLVPLQRGGKGTPLFCVHPAGGHVFCYLPLAREIGADRPVYGLQASGLDVGEPLAASVEAMAADYVAAIRAVEPVGPYRLLGLSSGGVVAFEMGRQLRDAGGEVELLALLDSTVPGSDAALPFTEEALLRALAGELGIADLVPDPPSTVADLVGTALEARLLPEGFTVAHAERIAGVFRNMVQLQRSYEPKAWDGPMVLARALRRERRGDRVPDWSHLVTGSLDVVDFDCAHGDFVSPGMAAAVARLISQPTSSDRGSGLQLQAAGSIGEGGSL